MQVLLGIILVPYYIGIPVSAYVYAARCGTSWDAYIVAFVHVPSRRNGIPWVIKTLGKIAVWPVVFVRWLRAGQPVTAELYGPTAAERLGRDPDTLNYATNGFATKWTAR
jgi:hypothetical protein